MHQTIIAHLYQKVPYYFPNSQVVSFSIRPAVVLAGGWADTRNLSANVQFSCNPTTVWTQPFSQAEGRHLKYHSPRCSGPAGVNLVKGIAGYFVDTGANSEIVFFNQFVQ